MGDTDTERMPLVNRTNYTVSKRLNHVLQLIILHGKSNWVNAPVWSALSTPRTRNLNNEQKRTVSETENTQKSKETKTNGGPT